MKGTRTPRIRVLVADAQLMVADALAIALGTHPDLEVLVGRPTTAPDAVAKLAALRPDVALLDYGLAGMEAPSVVHAALAQAPDTKVLHLSGPYGLEDVTRSRGSGAVGFLPKSLPVAAVAAAVRAAWAGETSFLIGGLQDLLDQAEQDYEALARRVALVSTLTPRELEVLRLLGAGRTVDLAARELGISPATVRRHVHHLLSKTESRSQLEAVSLAREAGFLP